MSTQNGQQAPPYGQQAPPYGQPPQATAHFNPVDLTFIRYRKGEAPETVTERRHMTFNLSSFRAMCDAAGIDRTMLADFQREQQERRHYLTKAHGQQRGEKKLREEIEARAKERGALSAVMPVPDGLEEHDQIAFIVWGALLAEDAGLNGGRYVITKGEVDAMLTDPQVQAYLFGNALDALMHYMTGRGMEEIKRAAERAKAENAEEASEGDAVNPPKRRKTTKKPASS